MNSLFFSYRFFKKGGKAVNLSSECAVKGEQDSYAYRYIKNAVKNFSKNGKTFEIILSKNIPDSIKERVLDKYVEHEESYALEVKEGKVYLYALQNRGLIYAVSTLIQLVQNESVTDGMLLFDYPDMDIRGYRVYTPGRAQIPTFKAMIDKLVYYKYNSVIIEIGGAMEYKRRPEINIEWEKFCKEISTGPDVARQIQSYTYPWRKDSIHFDNGNGSFITQEEMRDLIAYCEEREITVIPEVPTLSHSDYIVRTYRELNERVEDEYPDTYCPSNPKTYEVVFDIIDEVIEVFAPKYINIGHDEYYTAAQCPLCKGKSPVDLYVDDIIKINDYLKERNIKALMWADKFFGDPITGNAYPKKMVPDLMGCRGKVPTDITLLNWAWNSENIGVQEQLLHDLGYKLIFGNFDAISRADYRDKQRLHKGGFVSNWGSFEAEYMQRNLQNFWLVNTAYVFWSKDYTNADTEMLLEKVRKELYSDYKRTLGENAIELIHTTDTEKKYEWFWDGRFIVPSDWHIGDHTVTYTDGTEAKLPIIYGYNVRQSKIDDFETSLQYETLEAIGASYPFLKDGKVYYKTAYKNPYPEKKIAAISTEMEN